MERKAGAGMWHRVRAAFDARVDQAAEADAGFTLIELMVVLLILAILLAVAIPTFLNASNAAYRAQALTNLHNEMLTAKATYASQDGYDATDSMVLELNSSNPSLQATSNMSTATDVISVATYTSDGSSPATDPDNGVLLVLTSYSPKTETCWFGFDNVSTQVPSVPIGTKLGSFNTATPSDCDAGTAGGGGGLQAAI